MKQPLQCDPQTWIVLYNGGRAWAQAAPVAQKRFPPSTPGATLCEKTWVFVRFLTSKHHLAAAVPLPSATTALQITKDLRRPRRHTSDEAAITMRSEHLNRTLQWRTRPSASRTRRTTEVSPIDAGSDVVRENKGFRAIPNGQTSPELSNSTAICQITLQLQHASMNHPDITRTLPHLYCVTPLLFSPSLISPHPYYLHLY